MIKPAALTLLSIFVLLVGCASHEHYDYVPRGFFAAQPAGGEFPFEYTAEVPQALPIPQSRQGLEGYEVSRIGFPSSEVNGQPDNRVTARYLRSTSEPARAKPLLIVLPIWATHTFPPTVISNGYALHSQGQANVLWMDGDEPLFDWFKLAAVDDEAELEQEVNATVERFRAVAVDARRLIDWAETRPEIDSSRIALIGFSMGAIVAANIAGNEPRVSTTVLVMGAANPGKIMAECGMVVAYMRNRVKKKLGWSQQQFEQYFSDKLRDGNPARWQGRYRSDSTLIVEAGRDDCMPLDTRRALRTATGEPERLVLDYNHWQSFLALTPVGAETLSRDIYLFLDQHLLGSSGQGSGWVHGLWETELDSEPDSD
ncbi:MAG: dienelactone hydrolase family protein [Halioglobus sp.]